MMNCLKCGSPVTVTISNVVENTNGIEAQTKIQRAFCFKCGIPFRNNVKNFTLTIHRRNSSKPDGFSLLESGDTFSEMWVLVETYRELFKTDSNNRYLLRISTLKEEYMDENNKPRGRYLPIYEEVIKNDDHSVSQLQEDILN